MDKPRNPDAAAVALLRWILAGLLLLNGAALLVALKVHSIGLLGGFRSDYVAGLLCALAGGLCWTLSQAVLPRQDGDGWNAVRPEQRAARDHAVGFGALAILLWVASLTSFVAGCGHLSWFPAERGRRPSHAAGVAAAHRSLSGVRRASVRRRPPAVA